MYSIDKALNVAGWARSERGGGEEPGREPTDEDEVTIGMETRRVTDED